MNELVNKTLGQFQITRELGRGGMAVVYQAYQPALQRYVAKVLPPQLGLDPEFVTRFRHEAIAAAKLKHPNIVTVYDVGSEGGVNYIVMELIDGESLASVIRQSGAMPLERVGHILGLMAAALDYAHAQGFVHRDIKPGNIMLGAGDHVTLMDFGIAKALSGTRLTQTGTTIGTPEYMSPEQVRGAGVDHRSDIYSLGIVAYEMLTGNVPFSGDTASLLYKQVNEPPPMERLVSRMPPHVTNAVSRALVKDPAQRFQRASEFAAALSGTRPVAAPPPIARTAPRPAATLPPTPTTVISPGKAAWLGWGVAGLALLAVCVLVAILSVGPLMKLLGGSVTPAAQASAATATRTLIPTTRATLTLTSSAAQPTVSATAPRLITPSRTLSLRWSSIGRSVQGRDLSMASMGDGSKIAVVVVGSIQGDQPGTRDLVSALADYLGRNTQQVSEGVTFYLVPSLDPDGIASNSRYNANGVDLNRNWDTTDWRSDAAVPESPTGKPGAGGARPLSEPETQALRDFLFQLQPRVSSLRVVIVHSSTRRSQGEVYPGGDSSMGLTRVYASATGYDLQTAGWAEYPPTGELVTWCEQKGLLALDVVVPASQKPTTQVPGTNQTLLELNVQALVKIAD
jgi:serine/threonine protein kinase